MQAIILAAGLGRRLGEFTAGNTKCMVPVNGELLIERMLTQLQRLPLSRIVIVIGYEGAKLRDYIGERFPGLNVEYVENSIYDRTNNIYSLWLARDVMQDDDTLLLESDIIVDDAVIDMVYASEHPDVALVAPYEPWMDGTMVCLDDDDNIISFIPKKAFDYNDIDRYYKTVNIYKFSRDFASRCYLPFLEAYIKALGDNEYYEQVLRVITLVDTAGIKALSIGKLPWYEIDDVQDLRIAETIFADVDSRLEKLQHSYGGYWRYPGLKDFCYLVNPYFPTGKMIDEMKSNFDVLLRNYPSGMGVNSLLGAKYFGVRHDYVVTGNGAAELIKALMEHSEGRLGVTAPTFEEYPNRMDKDAVEVFVPDNDDFHYTADDLMAYFADKPISTLLVINPDNPSGNFIPRHDLMRLVEWTRSRGVRLVVDESFVDFAEGDDNTLLHNFVLERAPHLVGVESISKSYGVPGLRLGVLVSSDVEMVRRLRSACAIWNINSFGEYYMQIYGKYEKTYEEACRKIRKVRDTLFDELSAIGYLRVIPSAANYFLCEVTSRFSAAELTRVLLDRCNILIKDCSGKRGFPPGAQFIRIAVRDSADNRVLIDALKSL